LTRLSDAVARRGIPLHDSEAQPTISIVMATYNRPSVLAFAIRSALAQDFADWELIVIGDNCTDATAAQVASFADPRITYVNLTANFGDQSGPNNVGIGRARGRYIAFLNHDDIWFPDHLRAAVEHLQATNAEGIVARSAFIRRNEPDANGWRSLVLGIGIDGRYDPVLTVGPASGLVLKRETVLVTGPWRPALECFGPSSQQWLFRVWRTGADLRTMPQLTLVQIPSGSRLQSYVRDDTAEHEFFFAQMQDPAALRLLLRDHDEGLPRRPWWRRLAKPAAISALRLLAHLGLAPTEVVHGIALGFRRGRFIQIRRRRRGLPAMPERGRVEPQ
jgi:glycosyltransferase involved in cell wall biosynthesis